MIEVGVTGGEVGEGACEGVAVGICVGFGVCVGSEVGVAVGVGVTSEQSSSGTYFLE